MSFIKKYKIIEDNITYDVCEYINGTTVWYFNEKIHRENAPAIEHADGTKKWYKNGLIHREDGPATEYCVGRPGYWYNGKYLSNINTDEELKKYIKLLSIS